MAVPSQYVRDVREPDRRCPRRRRPASSAWPRASSGHAPAPDRGHRRGARPRSRSVGVLCGPNLAAEVVRHQPAATVLAFEDHAVATWLRPEFDAERFDVYTNDDVIGCEVGGSVKNVVAVAAGMAAEPRPRPERHLGALVCRGPRRDDPPRRRARGPSGDVPRAGRPGRPDGDLPQRAEPQPPLRRELAKGRAVQDIRADTNMVAEGVKSVDSILELAARARSRCRSRRWSAPSSAASTSPTTPSRPGRRNEPAHELEGVVDPRTPRTIRPPHPTPGEGPREAAQRTRRQLPLHGDGDARSVTCQPARVYERPDDPDYDRFEALTGAARAPARTCSTRSAAASSRCRFGLDHPYWIDDPDFDLDFHLRHIGDPAAGRRRAARRAGGPDHRPADRPQPPAVGGVRHRGPRGRRLRRAARRSTTPPSTAPPASSCSTMLLDGRPRGRRRRPPDDGSWQPERAAERHRAAEPRRRSASSAGPAAAIAPAARTVRAARPRSPATRACAAWPTRPARQLPAPLARSARPRAPARASRSCRRTGARPARRSTRRSRPTAAWRIRSVVARATSRPSRTRSTPPSTTS